MIARILNQVVGLLQANPALRTSLQKHYGLPQYLGHK
jgi:hypothetical protein